MHLILSFMLTSAASQQKVNNLKSCVCCTQPPLSQDFQGWTWPLSDLEASTMYKLNGQSLNTGTDLSFQNIDLVLLAQLTIGCYGKHFFLLQITVHLTQCSLNTFIHCLYCKKEIRKKGRQILKLLSNSCQILLNMLNFPGICYL